MKIAVKKAMRGSTRAYNEFLRHVLPEQGCWTEEKYLWLTDHARRLAEFTDGFIEVLPMPTDRHQSVLGFLYTLFTAFIEPLGGKVHFSGLRLKVREGKIREPDLLLVKNRKDPRRQDRFWLGADLTLEVVSKDNPRRDLVDKRHDYAEGGVPEYWIVNPLKETIIIYRLHGKRYKKRGEFGRGEVATSATLEGFSVKVDEVFDAD